MVHLEKHDGQCDYLSIRAKITFLLEKGSHKLMWIVSDGFFVVQVDWICGSLSACDVAIQNKFDFT